MFKSVNGGKLPTRGSKYSACVDVYANEDVVVGAGETKLVKLGIAIDLDFIKPDYISEIFCDDGDGNMIFSGYNEERYIDFLSSHYLQLMLRSSLGKAGLIMPSGVGVIDMDYAGEIMMPIHNPVTGTKGIINPENLIDVVGNTEHHIKKGDRIGQITLLEHKAYLFGIDTEDRRTGGFGSTGDK